MKHNNTTHPEGTRNMARTSNKDKAIAYAAEHGIIITVEDRDIFDGDYVVAEVLVCECCALWLSGDRTSCRDYFNHTHPNCDPAIIHLTDETFTIGYFYTNCNGCGTIQRSEATMYGAIRLAK